MACKEFPHLEFRSDLLKFHRVMERIRADIRLSHVELMQATPFWGLFESYLKGSFIEVACRKSDMDIVNILKCFNPDGRRFNFGGVIARVTDVDIAEIFGLPIGGEEIDLCKRKRKSDEGFLTRCFVGVKAMSKKILEDKIVEVVKLRDRVNECDFVRLVSLFFCVTIFFCNSGNTLGWNILWYVNDLGRMTNYAWAPAVKRHLENSLMEMNDRPDSACGCVIALLFWFCERTSLIEPIRGRAHLMPKFLKWNLLELYARLKIVDIHTLEVVNEVHNRNSNISDGTDAVGFEDFDVGTMLPVIHVAYNCENEAGPSYTSMEDPNVQFQGGLENKLKSADSIEKGIQKVEKDDAFTSTNDKVQELAELLAVEAAEKEFFARENMRLKEELELFQKLEDDGKSPSPENVAKRVKRNARKPLVLPEYHYGGVKRMNSSNNRLDQFAENKYLEQRVSSKCLLNVVPAGVHEMGQSSDMRRLLKVDNDKKSVTFRALPVGKLLSLPDAQKLKKYLEIQNPWVSLWQGRDAAVFTSDIWSLVNENDITLQTIDSYMEVLSNDQLVLSNAIGLKYCFMPTFSWEIIKGGYEKGKLAFYTEKIVENVRDKDFVFFPMHHENCWNFTLLVLDKRLGCWYHYNPQMPNRTGLDTCFQEAVKLHAAINKYLADVRYNAHTTIQKKNIFKYAMRRGQLYTEIYRMTDVDRDLYKWLKENNVIYPLRSNKRCPQLPDDGPDSGVAVMYLIWRMVDGMQLESTFNEGMMRAMRASILKKLLNANGVDIKG